MLHLYRRHRTRSPRFESREVLASAYGRRLTYKGAKKSMLRHAVEVDANHDAIRVLCNRVTFDNLADRGAGDPTRPPTCPACMRALVALERR
jgi:hypothetical protein